MFDVNLNLQFICFCEKKCFNNAGVNIYTDSEVHISMF